MAANKIASVASIGFRNDRNPVTIRYGSILRSFSVALFEPRCPARSTLRHTHHPVIIKGDVDSR